MKGTFFSSDFVTDKDGNLRLIEVNTDTGAVESQMSSFDWADFVSVLNSNNITELVVLYKTELQNPIVDNLESAVSGSSVTTFTRVIVPGSSIFPTSPEDSSNKFILRMAYDELAILDSEYAKGTLNLLKLFADNNDSESVINFYHNSSLYGSYNTLDNTIYNGSNLPDVVTKTVTELHMAHKFYKIGHSTDTNENRYNDFVASVSDDNTIIQQYHISPEQVADGTVTSIRSFQIVYGGDLDICYVAEYEIDAVLDLPTSVNYDDTVVNNLVDSKHYYEFASNHIKNSSHGILDDEGILDANGNVINIADMVVGQTYKGYHIEGLPETDDYDVLDAYFVSGNTLPAGSYETTTTLVSVGTDTTYANDMTLITFGDGSDVVVGGQTRFLVYCPEDDVIRFKRVLDLDTTHSIFKQDGTLNPITAIDVLIYDEQQTVYEVNMDPVNNFMLESGNFLSFFITHNLGGCFVEGTKVTMGNGLQKNIEEIIEGEEVLSYNETKLCSEVKKVIGLKRPVNQNMIKINFSNLDSIICTTDHPFYSENLNLVSYNPTATNSIYDLGSEVKEMKVGQLIKMKVGHTSIIGIEELPKQDTQTYVITVEDNHNFFVNNILVHNK